MAVRKGIVMKQYLVFDWGGTFLKYALMDEETNILEKGKVPAPSRHGTKEEFLQVIDEIVQKYEFEGIAISSPGILKSDTGEVTAIGVFPYWNGYNLKEEISSRYHTKVSVENDAKSAALAELWKGNLKGCQDGAVMILGTGVGGGIVLDGKLRRGKDYFAGEFSCVCMDVYHPDQNDVYWSSLGAKGLIRCVCKYTGKDPQSLSGEEAFALINEKNEDALKGLREYTDLLAVELFNLNILLNLDKICIGGGISAQPALMSSLKESIENLKNVHPDITGGLNLPLPVVDVCTFRNDANLIGALYHYLYE